MARYQIKVDPNLNVNAKAFGARIENRHVLIPSRLAHVFTNLSLGDDATTIAGFLTSFPTSVASSLGLSPDAVIRAADAFVDLLEDSGADVSSVRRTLIQSRRGAKHPRHIVP